MYSTPIFLSRSFVNVLGLVLFHVLIAEQTFETC